MYGDQYGGGHDNIEDEDEYRCVKQAFFRAIGPEVNPIEANKLGDKFRDRQLAWGEARQRFNYFWANDEVKRAREEWVTSDRGQRRGDTPE